MRILASWALAIFSLLSLRPGPASGQAACGPQLDDERVSSHRLLRQLSLDLRGRIPSFEEWERLEAGVSVIDVLLPEMLESEAYFTQVREQHRALLWAKLNGDELSIRRIFPFNSSGVWYSDRARRAYRGSGVGCLDQPQPADGYDSDGRPIPIRIVTGAEAEAMSCDPADGRNGELPRECRLEGWVELHPYWDMSSTIKVCAFDAQTLTIGSNGESCVSANPDPWCGCGPNVRSCLPQQQGGGNAQGQIRRALEEEAPRIFEAIVREGRPYHEAFTTRETWVNGATANFYRHQIGVADPKENLHIVYDGQFGEIPALPWDDRTWTRIERGEPHSGVLTTLLYLMRLTSNRSRANHFFSTFRCQPFVPPAEGLPEDTSAMPDPNLRRREGCSSCHWRLEPLAAHWGRWRTRGTHGYLDSAFFSITETDPRCAACGGEGQHRCASYCSAYFATGSNSSEVTLAEWAGRPLSRIYLDEEEARAIDVGPRMLVDEPDEIREVAECTVRTVAQRLLGRELTQLESIRWLPGITDDYASMDYNYTELVRLLVLTERYQSIR